MKLKRHDIRDAMKNKFVTIADSHKNVFTLEEVLYNVNEVVDELYWEHKRIKDQASSGKEEQKITVPYDLEVSNMAYKLKQAIGTNTFINEILGKISSDALKAILLEIANDFELDINSTKDN